MLRAHIRWLAAAAVAALPLWMAVSPAAADAPSGAIFTTVADGSEVNFNIYPSKDAVYLDGGPGPGAPQGAAGLDVDHGALTVQLMPYNDTPNPGGEYKVWVTMVSDYACFPDLSQVDCTAQ